MSRVDFNKQFGGISLEGAMEDFLTAYTLLGDYSALKIDLDGNAAEHPILSIRPKQGRIMSVEPNEDAPRKFKESIQFSGAYMGESPEILFRGQSLDYRVFRE